MHLSETYFRCVSPSLPPPEFSLDRFIHNLNFHLLYIKLLNMLTVVFPIVLPSHKVKVGFISVPRCL